METQKDKERRRRRKGVGRSSGRETKTTSARYRVTEKEIVKMGLDTNRTHLKVNA